MQASQAVPSSPLTPVPDLDESESDTELFRELESDTELFRGLESDLSSTDDNEDLPAQAQRDGKNVEQSERDLVYYESRC